MTGDIYIAISHELSVSTCHSGVALCTLCMTANGRDSVHAQYGTVRCIKCHYVRILMEACLYLIFFEVYCKVTVRQLVQDIFVLMPVLLLTQSYSGMLFTLIP
jgi:hypothetical protein